MDSIDYLGVEGLSAQRQAKLAELLDLYLQGWETSNAPTLEALVGENHDLLEPLRHCVEGLHQLTELAADEAHVTSHWQWRIEPNEPSRRLGDFELYEQLGEGAMGAVYRARQISLDRIVAVKVLANFSQFDSRQVARFTNEARLAADLDHPNIVSTQALGCDQGTHYFAMRYVAGQSLEKLLAGSTQTNSSHAAASPTVFPWESVIKLVADVADGLHAAHEMGVVHRDIKPSNLIYEPPSAELVAARSPFHANGKLWITDFGLARCQRAGDLTRSGDILGTFRYMSPEQARGESALVDGRSDVYSLGLTLYEMLSGQPAFVGAESPQLLHKIANNEIVSLRRLCPDLPRDLYAVVEKATSQHRDDRYQTAKEFADDLRRVVAGEPTLARAATLLDKAANWAFARRRGVAVAITLGIIALSASAYATASISAAKHESDLSRQQALQNERIARDAVEHLGGQVSQWLEGVPAAEPLRRQVLNTTLQYYQRIVDQGNESPETLYDLAIIRGKIGQLQEELGELDQAIAAYRDAERRLTQVVAQPAPTFDHYLALATCLNNLGFAYHQQGRLDEAAAVYVRAENAFMRLSESSLAEHQSAGSNQLIRQQAITTNNLGRLYFDLDDNRKAEDCFRLALEQLASANGSSHQQLRLTIQTNLAESVSRRSIEEAVRIAGKVWKSLPHLAQTELKTTSELTQHQQRAAKLGEVFETGGQWSLAEESYQEAARASQLLIELRPDWRPYREQVVEYTHRTAIAWHQLDNPGHASTLFKQALNDLAAIDAPSVAADDPLQDIRITIYRHLIPALRDAGQQQEARQYEHLVRRYRDDLP